MVPGLRLLSEPSRSPRELGRWVGGAGAGNPSRDRRVPGQVPARGAECRRRVPPLSSPGPPPSPPPARSRRPAAQLCRELSSPKLQEMFSQVAAVEARARSSVCSRARSGGEVRGEASHLAKEIPLFVGVRRAR